MVYENMRSGQNIGRIKAAPNLVNICVDEIAQEEREAAQKEVKEAEEKAKAEKKQEKKDK